MEKLIKNLEFGVGVGRASHGVFAVIGLCLLAWAVPCIADEVLEVESGKRKAVDGALMAEDGAPNTEHRTPNAEGGSLNPEPRTLNPVPPAPMTEEEYRAELMKIQDMLGDRHIALDEAERTLLMRQRELESLDERCGALAKEIRELRAEIAAKEKELNGLFEQDEEVARIKDEIEKRKEALQEARKKLSELVKRRKAGETLNIQHSTSEHPIFNIQHGEKEGE